MSVRTVVHASEDAAAGALTEELTSLLARRPTAVLGWATGRTPVALYRALRVARAAGTISFARATSFNLDEYLGLPSDDPRRFRAWMRVHLLDELDLPFERAWFPDVDATDPDRAATAYEHALECAGGVDWQVLGVGRNGHVAFNEPGSEPTSRTRVVRLAESTRADAAAAFGGREHVPTHAITMGVATILAARSLRVLAFGPAKAPVVRAMLSEAPSSDCPASYLSRHGDVELHVDEPTWRAATGG